MTRAWLPAPGASWASVPEGLRFELTSQTWKHAGRAQWKVRKLLVDLSLATREQEPGLRRRLAHNLRLMVARYALCEAAGFVHADEEEEEETRALHEAALVALRGGAHGA